MSIRIKRRHTYIHSRQHHDISGAITHKRETITLYLEGYFTTEIAMKANHSKEAVDRYIRDYHRIEILWTRGIYQIDQICQLVRLSKCVARQYIDLLPDKVRKMKLNINVQSNMILSVHNCLLLLSYETEAASAEEQPARDSRIERNGWRAKWALHTTAVTFVMPYKTYTLDAPLVV